MKTPEPHIPAQNTPKKESGNSKRTYKIEHLSKAGIDVVLNLDYSSQEDTETILNFVKNEGIDLGQLETYGYMVFGPENEKNKFFVKRKNFRMTQLNVDFILGRSKADPIHPDVVEDFDVQARRAISGVLNEISLSPKIKKLVASSPFQELAKKYGFIGISFVDPIAAVIDAPSRLKYLIYKNIKRGWDIELSSFDWKESEAQGLIEGLRKLFLTNGIVAHDLFENQLLIDKQDGGYHLYLLDIEAYTEVPKITDSPKS